MNKIFQWGFGVMVMVSFLFPVGVTAQSATISEIAYREQLLQLIASLQQQIAELTALLAKQEQRASVNEESSRDPLRETVKVIAAYPITTTANTQTISNSTHRAYFNRVFALFPDQYDAYIGQAIVFDEGESTMDAFVETMPPTHTKWIYAVNEGVIDEPLAAWNTELIIHELAHLIAYEKTANSETVKISCKQYFLRHGCPPADSYLRAYVAQFWDEVDLRRADRNAGDSETAYEYYEEHPHEYVSEYAALSPEEDFAESLLYFVLEQPVVGKTAKEKVVFFAGYKSMLAIKQEINQVQ